MKKFLNNLGSYAFSRLKEPSTWVGLGSLATAVGWRISPENWNLIASICMGLSGLIAASLPARVEEKNVTPAAPLEPTPLSAAMEQKLQVPEANVTPTTAPTPLSDSIKEKTQ